jgi:hypothetical protein
MAQANKLVKKLHVAVQSGMQEAHESTVELGNIEGPVLRLLISAMYGNYNPESLELLVPLFVAADAHQVRTLVWRWTASVAAPALTSGIPNAAAHKSTASDSMPQKDKVVNKKAHNDVTQICDVCLQVKAARAVCLKQLINSISIETALQYYSTADLCTEHKLKDACTSFIAKSENRYTFSSITWHHQLRMQLFHPVMPGHFGNCVHV